MIVVIRQAVIVKTAPAWMVSAIVTMGTGVKAATCPMTMSANTDPAMYLLIVPIHWVATFARAEKVTRETVINVPILMSAKIPCSPPDACKMPSVATYPPTLSANVNPASRGMEKSSAEVREKQISYGVIRQIAVWTNTGVNGKISKHLAKNCPKL